MKPYRIPFTLLILAILLWFLPGASAQSDGTVVKVAAGSSSGTYKAFLKEIQAAAIQTVTFQETDSHGSVGNLDDLVTNKASLAFMHADVLDFRSRRENLKAFETLLVLFKEEVHVLAPARTKRPGTKTGGRFGFGGTVTPAPEINAVEDLKAGYRVGAAGGGAITAQVIRLTAGIPYEFIEFTTGKEVMDALSSGQIDAAVFVGGAPLPNVQDLGKDFKLLPFGQQTIAALKTIYTPTTLTYPKMSPVGVSTIAADCLLVGRKYRSEKMVNLLKSVRSTFAKHLLELQETPGIHPKWSEVSLDNKGFWPYMEFDAK